MAVRDIFRVDRTHLSVGRMEDQTREYREGSLLLTDEERLLVMQQLRECVHGKDIAAGRLQRFLEVSQRVKG